jgi:RNA 2',3'-cyclic 3'-phosphodiesterase
MRLFVALEVPEAVRENLAAMRKNFSSIDSRLRWVPSQNFHVTLKFIGSVPDEKLQAITEALRSVSIVQEVQFCIRGLTWYFNPKTSVMLWASVEDSKPLTALAAAVDQRLASMGIAPENRSFAPHFTLARGNSRNLTAGISIALSELAEKYKKHDFGSVTAKEFHLIESKTLPTGPVYSKIQSFPFVGAGN